MIHKLLQLLTLGHEDVCPKCGGFLIRAHNCSNKHHKKHTLSQYFKNPHQNMKFKIGDHILYTSLLNDAHFKGAHFKGIIIGVGDSYYQLKSKDQHIHYPITRLEEQLKLDKNHYLKIYLQKPRKNTHEKPQRHPRLR